MKRKIKTVGILAHYVELAAIVWFFITGLLLNGTREYLIPAIMILVAVSSMAYLMEKYRTYLEYSLELKNKRLEKKRKRTARAA